ncbi:hypothetical protein BDQ17DRAFT_1432553 [Cyathus striatus]|nr:hypothetical protein BDQ17DRAFT_1432553 [Cyathus striatus]
MSGFDISSFVSKDCRAVSRSLLLIGEWQGLREEAEYGLCGQDFAALLGMAQQQGWNLMHQKKHIRDSTPNAFIDHFILVKANILGQLIDGLQRETPELPVNLDGLTFSRNTVRSPSPNDSTFQEWELFRVLMHIIDEEFMALDLYGLMSTTTPREIDYLTCASFSIHSTQRTRKSPPSLRCYSERQRVTKDPAPSSIAVSISGLPSWRCMLTSAGMQKVNLVSLLINRSSSPRNTPVLMDITRSPRRFVLGFSLPNTNYTGAAIGKRKKADEDSGEMTLGTGVDGADCACEGDALSRLEGRNGDGRCVRRVAWRIRKGALCSLSLKLLLILMVELLLLVT